MKRRLKWTAQILAFILVFVNVPVALAAEEVIDNHDQVIETVETVTQEDVTVTDGPIPMETNPDSSGEETVIPTAVEITETVFEEEILQDTETSNQEYAPEANGVEPEEGTVSPEEINSEETTEPTEEEPTEPDFLDDGEEDWDSSEEGNKHICPECPDTPECPDCPETPDNPEIPETPENPETPETPQEHETPENSTVVNNTKVVEKIIDKDIVNQQTQVVNNNELTNINNNKNVNNNENNVVINIINKLEGGEFSEEKPPQDKPKVTPQEEPKDVTKEDTPQNRQSSTIIVDETVKINKQVQKDCTSYQNVRTNGNGKEGNSFDCCEAILSKLDAMEKNNIKRQEDVILILDALADKNIEMDAKLDDMQEVASTNSEKLNAANKELEEMEKELAELKTLLEELKSKELTMALPWYVPVLLVAIALIGLANLFTNRRPNPTDPNNDVIDHIKNEDDDKKTVETIRSLEIEEEQEIANTNKKEKEDNDDK